MNMAYKNVIIQRDQNTSFGYVFQFEAENTILFYIILGVCKVGPMFFCLSKHHFDPLCRIQFTKFSVNKVHLLYAVLVQCC